MVRARQPRATGDAGVELELAGFASSAAEDEQLSAIIDAYNEQSSNTASFNPLPEYDTTLQAQLAGGEPPDVFYINDNRLADLAETGTLASAEGNVDDPDAFYENLVEGFSHDGTWYCPAKDFSTLGLQYNVDMLDDAGVEPPTTWDELAAAAEQLTTGDQVGLVIAPEWFRWGVFALQAGGDIDQRRPHGADRRASDACPRGPAPSYSGPARATASRQHRPRRSTPAGPARHSVRARRP